MELNKKFWNGKRVFVTGHTGFKGSWLSLWLNLLGAEVTGFSLNPPSKPNLHNILKNDNDMVSIAGDIRDGNLLNNIISECNPEIVIHMAAQPLVRHSYKYPVETYSTNVMGTVNLLESVKNNSGVKAVLVITTDKCYKNKEWDWGYREDDTLGGADPYSNSKACAELVCEAYTKSYFNKSDYSKHGIALATARAGNVIGGGDWAKDRLIPDIIDAFIKREVVNIRNPNSIRPWQHVLEPINGYLLLLENLYRNGVLYSGAWNFGPRDKDAKTVGCIVEKIVKLWDNKLSWKTDKVEHPHEAKFLKLDISKAINRLKWKPVMDLDMALKYTIEWAIKYHNNKDIKEYSISQIKKYQNLKRND